MSGHILICPLLAIRSFLGKQILTFVSALMSAPVTAPALVTTGDYMFTKCGLIAIPYLLMGTKKEQNSEL